MESFSQGMSWQWWSLSIKENKQEHVKQISYLTFLFLKFEPVDNPLTDKKENVCDSLQCLSKNKNGDNMFVCHADSDIFLSFLSYQCVLVTKWLDIKKTLLTSQFTV